MGKRERDEERKLGVMVNKGTRWRILNLKWIRGKSKDVGKEGTKQAKMSDFRIKEGKGDEKTHGDNFCPKEERD